jgi:nicotinamide riboside kinase
VTPAPLLLAIVGAESTGKTRLAAALSAHLAQQHGLRSAWVPETLREWCDAFGRTPLAHEQAAILRRQHERIAQAAEQHEVVVCDTTGLMTAVYSRQVFGDRSLDERAVQLHRRMDLTLLMALDLPWVADGLQRDGPQVREPVDAQLRELLLRHRLPWALVSGQGEARLASALAAVLPLLVARQPLAGAAPRKLFTGLQARRARGEGGGHPRWDCDCCPPPAAPGP